MNQHKNCNPAVPLSSKKKKCVTVCFIVLISVLYLLRQIKMKESEYWMYVWPPGFTGLYN